MEYRFPLFLGTFRHSEKHCKHTSQIDTQLKKFAVLFCIYKPCNFTNSFPKTSKVPKTARRKWISKLSHSYSWRYYNVTISYNNSLIMALHLLHCLVVTTVIYCIFLKDVSVCMLVTFWLHFDCERRIVK